MVTPGKALHMDDQTTDTALKCFLREIHDRLEQASGIAKAAQACADAGNVSKAVEIALDVEQPIYEATTLLNAASLINRIGETWSSLPILTSPASALSASAVGSLAQLLRYRLFISETVYRGAVHIGEHEPILDRPLFDVMQAKLTASATARQLKLKGTPSILAGRIFDAHGNRMTTHTNKQGARYRYYALHSTLQKRERGTRKTIRVSAPDLEAMIVKAIAWPRIGFRRLSATFSRSRTLRLSRPRPV
jgi:hypothetical protein